MRRDIDPGGPRTDRGFTLIEALVSMLLVLIIVGSIFGFAIDTTKSYKSQNSQREMQQAARIAVDELARAIQQSGFGTQRADPYNRSLWQRDLIYAGSHALAFNADLDASLGPLDATRTIGFPTGETYTGEGPAASTVGAEARVYTLDADGDDDIDLGDRQNAETGSYNPAALTPNPGDFALFLRIHGYDGSAYVEESVPLLPYLFTNAVNTIDYPDGTVPEPLFTYVLNEDLNRDGILDDTECVNDAVDACPPGTARGPRTYIWGDTDFDGTLSDAERDALIDLPVGDVGWSKNRLAGGGVYISTLLASAIDPTGSDPHIVEVASAAKIPPGAHIRIGSGASAETFVVESVSEVPAPDLVVLASDPLNAHAAGEALEVLPASLLQAVVAVRINVIAMTPRPDRDGGEAVAGLNARQTVHGMDYRTITVHRTVRLANLQAEALR